MSKGKVIIIEDEFFAAQHLSDLVKSFGFSVEGVYHSGESFLKETDWQFDMAIIDIFLSEELTGLDLAIHLNEKQKPYIFLTANQDSQTLKEAAMLSPASYLSKPFKPNDVEVALGVIRVKNAIEHKSIIIKEGHLNIKIPISSICCVKSDNNYLEIMTPEKKFVIR